jgi:hypothetical protein
MFAGQTVTFIPRVSKGLGGEKRICFDCLSLKMVLSLNKPQERKKKDILLLSCERHSRARHYIVQEWPVGWDLFPGQ